jgi:hypothetical protein
MSVLRMVVIDIPALIITWVFRAYFVFLAVMTILCFGSVLIAIAAAILGLPYLE